MSLTRLARGMLSAVLLLTLASALPCSAKCVYVKWDSPGPTFDGTSWAMAFRKVQSGIDAAVSGDDVWVARGLYVENVDLKDGVGLYGGFAGAETSRAQRSYRANETILDGSGWQDDTVDAPSGATATTVIDGFTIRKGYPPGNGGGVSCYLSSPTIANNIITENRAPDHGGGIWCGYGSPTITGNVIVANGADGNGGIACMSSSAIITNNTIVSNNGHGILCNGESSPVIANNIIAFNTSGIRTETGTGSPVAHDNCVYGNTKFDFSGSLNSFSNISTNPRLADNVYGNLHIQPDSPCVNRGVNSASGISPTDVDGQQRVQGGTVDIGADESDGTAWSTGPYAVIRVSQFGSDANDGSNWALAKQTVQAGIDAAKTPGGEVWVTAGMYTEHIYMRPHVYIYGGFAGTETAREQRDWALNRSVIDGGANRAVVTAWYSGYLVCAIDGFTIRNGHQPYFGKGGGISCFSSSPIIANNMITGNSATTHGGGIGCSYGASPIIVNNTITGNIAPLGGGIGCDAYYTSWPTVTNNSIFGNTASNGGGIYSAESPAISNNIVVFNSGGGIYSTEGTPALRNNCVYGNADYEYSGLSAGTGDISADPLLFEPASGDCHLTPSSPCINAGWGSAPSLPSTDMDGQPRTAGAAVDIGADEYPGSWTPPAVSTPMLFPDGGAYPSAPEVSMICMTPGAIIHFTTNGMDPAESDPAYVTAVPVQAGQTLKARAFKAEWTPSAVKSAVYAVMPTIETPTFDPSGGTYTSAQSVTINCATPDVIIRYTLNGGDPTGYDPVYSGPLVLNSDTTTIRARAWKTDWNTSNVAVGVYVLPVQTPTFSPDGGVFASSRSVTIGCGTAGAIIHYTTNDSDPTESDPVYAEPVLVGTSLTLKARAYREGWPASAVKSAAYVIDTSASAADAKMLPNESPVAISRALVVAVFLGYFYIQADDRSSGIRVDKIGYTPTLGMRVDLSGTIKTNAHGERYILAATAAQSEPPANMGSAQPLRLTVQCLGGAAWRYDAATGAGQIGVSGSIHLNNIGLLVRTTGLVTYSPTGTTFVVSDGSEVTDVSGYQGTKIIVPIGVTKPATGKRADVTGISSIIKSGTAYYPVIRVRTQGDIVLLD